MITLHQLEKSYGARTLFADVSLQLNAGARYGLVGANGSGKTTLLKVLLGDEEATRGKIAFQKNARVGTLRQDRFLDDDLPILDVAMQGDAEAWAALHGTDDDEMRRTEAHTLAARAGAVLEGLGIRTAVHKQPLRTLSGGFKLRVLLAQGLIARPDILLLDEPTNHLDILSIRWLEKFLDAFPGCAVVISHDQRFLENTVTHILDVDYGTITLYPGGFGKFIV